VRPVAQLPVQGEQCRRALINVGLISHLGASPVGPRMTEEQSLSVVSIVFVSIVLGGPPPPANAGRPKRRRIVSRVGSLLGIECDRTGGRGSHTDVLRSA